MSTVRKALLTLAATTVGLTSGVMFCYRVAVMPGLGRLSDRDFVTAFQAIDRSIVNPVFLVGAFLSGAVWLAAATVVHRRERRRFRLLAAASVVYVLGVVVVTVAGHVPMNERLAGVTVAAASDAEVTAARTEFEGPWNRLHLVRTGAAVASLVLVNLALLVGDSRTRVCRA